MAAIAVSELGADISFAAANAGGDTVLSGTVNGNHVLDGVYLLVDNGHSGEWDVTVDGTVHAVPAGEIHAIAVNRGVYPGTSIAVTYEGVTALTVAAFRT